MKKRGYQNDLKMAFNLGVILGTELINKGKKKRLEQLETRKKMYDLFNMLIEKYES